MKFLNYLNIIFACVIFTQVSFSQDKNIKVYNFVNKLLTNCSEVPKLTSKNATSSFRKYYDNGKLSNYCRWSTERYGEVTNITLQEVLLRNNKEVYRYKVKRDKADWFFEIRIFLDDKDKFYSINSKSYWSDTFYAWGEDPKYVATDTTTIDQAILKQNHEFAFKSYNICEASEIFDVNETNGIYRSIRKGWKKEMLEECQSIKTTHGNFKNLEFQQYLTDSVSGKIYRYKVQFDKLKQPSEIRIYSRLNDKYSGIFVIDVWYDTYVSLKKAREKSKNELGN